MIYRAAIVFTLLLLTAAGVAVADTLILKDGKVYQGKIIKQTKSEVKFEIHRLGGKLTFIRTFDIENVHSITEGKIEVEVKKPKPTSKSATRPESRPTTKPKDKAATRKLPRPVTIKKMPKPVGHLATPETLAKALQANPRHPSEDRTTWETLTSIQKGEAEKKYQEKLEEHRKKKDFRGKSVSWTLKVCDVAKAKDGKSFTLTSKSPKGTEVTATVSAAAKDYMLKLKKGDSVRVRGIIAGYDFTKPPSIPGELFADHRPLQFSVEIKDASVMLTSDIPLVVLFEQKFEADKTIFLVDSSGSMVDKIDATRFEVAMSVSRLNPKQEFAVVFFKNARYPASIRLKKATDRNKAASKERALQVRAAGQSHMLPYLVKALKALAQGKEDCSICLMTDGVIGDDEVKKIFDAIKKYNPDNRVLINTFLLCEAEADKESTELLQTIAEFTGGEFSHVKAE